MREFWKGFCEPFIAIYNTRDVLKEAVGWLTALAFMAAVMIGTVFALATAIDAALGIH